MSWSLLLVVISGDCGDNAGLKDGSGLGGIVTLEDGGGVRASDGLCDCDVFGIDS